VPQDFLLAYMWMDLAAASYAPSVKSREAIAARMTPDQIAQAQQLARDWKQTATK
jgi:hypothetical protein